MPHSTGITVDKSKNIASRNDEKFRLETDSMDGVDLSDFVRTNADWASSGQSPSQQWVMPIIANVTGSTPTPGILSSA